MQHIMELLRKIHALAQESGLEHQAITDIQALAKQGLDHAEAAIAERTSK